MKKCVLSLLCAIIVAFMLLPVSALAWGSTVTLPDGRVAVLPGGWTYNEKTGAFMDSGGHVYEPEYDNEDPYFHVGMQMNMSSWDCGVFPAGYDPSSLGSKSAVRLGDNSFPMATLVGIASVSAALCAFAMLRYRSQVTQ